MIARPNKFLKLTVTPLADASGVTVSIRKRYVNLRCAYIVTTM